MISTLMIILMNNNEAKEYLTENEEINAETKANDIVEYAIANNFENLKLLPNFFFTDNGKNEIKEEYKSILINFFTFLRKRFINKERQQRNVNNSNSSFTLTRKASLTRNNNNNNSNNSSVENRVYSCETQISGSFKKCFHIKTFDKDNYKHGGLIYEEYFYNYYYYYFYVMVNYIILKNVILMKVTKLILRI